MKLGLHVQPPIFVVIINPMRDKVWDSVKHTIGNNIGSVVYLSVAESVPGNLLAR